MKIRIGYFLGGIRTWRDANVNTFTIYDLEKRLAAGSRVKKARPPVMGGNPRRAVKNERSDDLSMGPLEHKQVKKSREKNSPDACPLAEAGREAIYNSSWQMRNKASITHSTSRGLVASLFIITVCIFQVAGFCRSGEGSLAQSNKRGNYERGAKSCAGLDE